MLFVCERVRKAAANKRQPQRAERAMHTEGAEAFSSASDDEVGGLQARCANGQRNRRLSRPRDLGQASLRRPAGDHHAWWHAYRRAEPVTAY